MTADPSPEMPRRVQFGSRVIVRPLVPSQSSWSQRMGAVVEVVAPGNYANHLVKGGAGNTKYPRYVVHTTEGNLLRRPDQLELAPEPAGADVAGGVDGT